MKATPSLKYIPFTRASEIVADMPRKPGSRFADTETLILASDVLQGIFELGNRAGAGEQESVEWLWNLAHNAAVELRAAIDENPKLFRDLISSAPQFPMLVALHPENEKANRDFLKRIRLGERAQVNAHSGSRWSRENAATVWANDVIETLRANQRRYKFITGKRPHWVRKCGKLPALSKDTAAHWWKVGKVALLERFPDPHEITDLAKLVKSEGIGRKRSRVLYLIGRALHSIAAKEI
jgi:hypothetical protein